jgi:hypothetical protein
LDEAAAWQNQSAALALSILQTEEGYINDALSEINYCIIFATNNNDVQGIDFFNGLKLHLQSELDVVAKLKNTATALQGSLQVNIYPEEAVNAGAEWKLTTDSTWYPDGYTLIGLQTGSVTVEFKSITGWTCPNEKTVDIQPSQTAKIIGLYKRFGELDDDCTVDFKDFAVLTSWWLEGCTEPNWCESTDFDHSTIVDIRDLEIFTDSWLWALSDYYFITKWGTSGNGDGQFDRPLGVTADFNGYVYVVDAYNNRIQKFTVDGDYVTKWGQRGSGIGQFITPRDIAVDSSDFIYVTDNHNHRVQKFTSNGTYVMQWGNAGRSNGEFSYPSGIDTGPLGFIYVADYGNHRVQKFTSTGAYVTQWGSSGSGDGQFRFPIELAIDSSGYVYVADADNHRIQKWTSNGVFVGWWGGCNDPSHAGSGHWHGPGSSHQPQPGTGDGQFTGTISGVGVDSSGNVYVTDQSNRFQKFDSNGGFIGWWGGCSNPSHTGTGHWHEPGSGHQPQQGSGDGQFDYPVSLDVDSNGNVYVTDYYNYRVQKFSPCCAE